jgi:signal transduction histidine kinase
MNLWMLWHKRETGRTEAATPAALWGRLRRLWRQPALATQVQTQDEQAQQDASVMEPAPPDAPEASNTPASALQIESIARQRGAELLADDEPDPHAVAAAATEIAQLAENLAELSTARNQFLSKVSHELRTPLTVAKGWISMLRYGTLLPEQERVVSVIDQQIDDLTRLVNDLLDLSRRETGALELKLETIDLVQLVAQVAEYQQEIVAALEVELRLRCEVPSALTFADRGRVAQVLNNMIGNAVRYVPHFANGWIEVRVTHHDDRFCVSVADNGIGIAAEHLPRIFEPFYQIDGMKHGKSGLGLALAQELIQAHGGSLTVESTPGLGTAFHICLQAIGAEETAPEASKGVSHG